MSCVLSCENFGFSFSDAPILKGISFSLEKEPTFPSSGRTDPENQRC